MRISDWSSDVCSSDLYQMGHVGVPQTVRVQHRVQAEVVAPVGEPVIDVGQPDTSLAFGRPQHRRVRQFEPWQDIGDVLLQDRKSVVEGKRVSVSVDLGGRRIIKKKKY